MLVRLNGTTYGRGIIARRAFVWATLKFVCPSVRAATTTTTDFGPVSSLCRSARDTILGWHCEGIRDHLKSTSQSVLQKHTCRSQHVTCQKHTFFDQKSTTQRAVQEPGVTLHVSLARVLLAKSREIPLSLTGDCRQSRASFPPVALGLPVCLWFSSKTV